MEYIIADGQKITINNRCHSTVKTAIQCFAQKCKNHTTTSRKFPLLILLRAHIDQVVADYLKTNSINALADQFAKDGFSSFANGSIRKTVDLLSAEIKRRSPAIQGIVTLEEFFEVQPTFSEPKASVF